jgi:hypothetical protein
VQLKNLQLKNPAVQRTVQLEIGESSKIARIGGRNPSQNGSRAGETPSKLNNEVTLHATQVHETNRGHEISPGISRRARARVS